LRSFYLDPARAFPQENYAPISLGTYLLARSDNDCRNQSAVASERNGLAHCNNSESVARGPSWGTIAEHQTSAAEKQLLERLEDCVIALGQLMSGWATHSELLKIIIGGRF